MPFDLEEAIYLGPIIDSPMTSSELLAVRARHLEKRHDEIDAIRRLVSEARHKYADRFAEVHKHKIRDYDFRPGQLALLRNTKNEADLGGKLKARYLGPYVVLRKTKAGTYEIAELDGARSKLKVAAFRLIPYFPRSNLTVPLESLDLEAQETLDAEV